jgi:hypothetical protein
VRVLALAVALSFSLTAVYAADPKSTSPELIDELCQVMHLEKNAEMGVDLVLRQMENQMGPMLNQIFGSVDPKDKEKMEARKKEFLEFNTRFRSRFRELLKERLNLGREIKNIYGPLFDRHFTTDEIKQLIAFYKSSLGARLLTTMPKVMQEAMAKSAEVLNPKMVEIVKVIIEDEKKRAEAKRQEAPAPSPAK